MKKHDKTKKEGKLRTAILGSGNIGTDLLVKILRSPYLECTLFIGRRSDSPGMNKARELGIKTSDQGIDSIINNPSSCDLVFDATNAVSHLYHWPILKNLGKIVIDLTPSLFGKKIIPAVNLPEASKHRNINMVSCGGQAAIALAYAFTQVQKNVDYIEVVSSIASRSAGPATRINIDEYIENTEKGIREFTGCPNVKTILILNPAKPDINMQVSLSLKTKRPDIKKISHSIFDMEKKISKYVPGYKIIVPPVVEDSRVFITVKVTGLGDYLPRYAGNLDIMNCAAIASAQEYSKTLYPN